MTKCVNLFQDETFGCRMLGAGCGMRDAGCGMRGEGCWVRDACGMLGAGGLAACPSFDGFGCYP